jgi:hypothetical protein
MNLLHLGDAMDGRSLLVWLQIKCCQVMDTIKFALVVTIVLFVTAILGLVFSRHKLVRIPPSDDS